MVSRRISAAMASTWTIPFLWFEDSHSHDKTDTEVVALKVSLLVYNLRALLWYVLKLRLSVDTYLPPLMHPPPHEAPQRLPTGMRGCHMLNTSFGFIQLWQYF